MRVTRKRAWIFAAGLAALLLAVGVVIYLALRKSGFAPKIINQAAQAVSYPLYYPTSLPGGFTLSESSVRASGQTVFFNFVDGNKTISVTEQPASVGFDFGQVTDGDTHVVAGLGKVVYQNNQEFNGAGIEASKTTIFLNDPQHTPTGDFATFAESFKEVN